MGINHLSKWSNADPANGAKELAGASMDKFHQPQDGGDKRPLGVRVNPTMPKVAQVQKFSAKAVRPTTKAMPHPSGKRAGARHVPNSQVSGKVMSGKNMGRPVSGGRMG